VVAALPRGHRGSREENHRVGGLPSLPTFSPGSAHNENAERSLTPAPGRAARGSRGPRNKPKAPIRFRHVGPLQRSVGRDHRATRAQEHPGTAKPRICWQVQVYPWDIRTPPFPSSAPRVRREGPGVTVALSTSQLPASALRHGRRRDGAGAAGKAARRRSQGRKAFVCRAYLAVVREAVKPTTRERGLSRAVPGGGGRRGIACDLVGGPRRPRGAGGSAGRASGHTYAVQSPGSTRTGFPNSGGSSSPVQQNQHFTARGRGPSQSGLNAQVEGRVGELRNPGSLAGLSGRECPLTGSDIDFR
jgi:hypothetical protein